MKSKRGWTCLLGFAIVVVLGGSWLRGRMVTDKRIRAAFSRDEQQVLEDSEQFTLYSLDPDPMAFDPQALKKKPAFHGFIILGQTRVAEAKTRADLLAALYAGLGKGDLAACFNPRHGIRAVRDRKTVDLVICFECGQIQIYGENGEHEAPTDHSPEKVFDRTLTEARMPLAP